MALFCSLFDLKETTIQSNTSNNYGLAKNPQILIFFGMTEINFPSIPTVEAIFFCR